MTSGNVPAQNFPKLNSESWVLCHIFPHILPVLLAFLAYAAGIAADTMLTLKLLGSVVFLIIFTAFYARLAEARSWVYIRTHLGRALMDTSVIFAGIFSIFSIMRAAHYEYLPLLLNPGMWQIIASLAFIVLMTEIQKKRRAKNSS